MIRYIFLNQMAGPLFRELAEDLSAGNTGNILLTGHPDTLLSDAPAGLEIRPAPEYDRSGQWSRFWSWIRFFSRAFRTVMREDRERVLIIVSNPPFLGGVGLFFKLLRRQRYALLVYDIYPDLLVALGRVRFGGIVQIWCWFNRMVYERAEVVFTLSDAMAANLGKQFDANRTAARQIIVTPAWADVERIKPLPQEQNKFAQEMGLLTGTTVLYSGNMGLSHDLGTLLAAVERLSVENGLRFLFIGNGSQEGSVRQIAARYPETVTWLPLQPEEILHLSLAAGDIGIVSCQRGTKGLMIPSKTYYYLAAGLAPIFIGDTSPDLVCGCDIGGHVGNGDVDELVKQIRYWHGNREELAKVRLQARKIAETHFSRNNTAIFRNTLCRYLERAR